MANDINEVGYVHPSGTVTYIPSAASIQVRECGNVECGHVHIFLMDQAGQPIAEATLSNDLVDRLIEARRRPRR